MQNTITPPAPILIKDLGMQYPSEKSKNKYKCGIYKCSCGKEFKAQTSNINSNGIKSCGCYNILKIKQRSITHGLRSHRIYRVWWHMIERTEKPSDKRFSSYGGRGIKICKEWRDSVVAFYDWSMSNGYKEGLTIDRINNDGNYEPSNCRWTTKEVQARNTRVLMSTNTSGYRGVQHRKIDNKWLVYISIDNKTKYLGTFSTAIEGAKAYNSYVIDNNLEHTINPL